MLSIFLFLSFISFGFCCYFAAISLEVLQKTILVVVSGELKKIGKH